MRSETQGPGQSGTRGAEALRDWGRALGIFVLCTAAALALRTHVAATNLAMIYLLGVVAVATRCSLRVSIAACLLSVAAFDFFCVPPYLTLRVTDYEYLITFAGMLAVALVISMQTARIRLHAADAGVREARTGTLYRLSRHLAHHTRTFELTRAAADFVEGLFPAQVVIFLPEDRRITFSRRSSDHLPLPRSDEAVAQSAFDRGEKIVSGNAVYVPLKASSETVGVIAVVPREDATMSQEQLHLFELCANQVALAIERTLSQHAAEDARVRMKSEEMRSSLLSAVSHDLRTPLASITGAASTLRSQSQRLQPEMQNELLDSIAEEAERLNRLVGNLIDMTRLQSNVELRRDLYPIEEIVGAALQRMDRQLADRKVITSLPDSVPLVHVDDVLFGQIFVNLLENAAKYTPPGSPIEIASEAGKESVWIEVRDRGPGFEEGEEQRIFEKFYRGGSKPAQGAGLGLAICRAIAEAHGGSIRAFNRAGGGAVFQVRLPLEGAL